MTETQHTCVVRVNLFLFKEITGLYEEYGSVGCAIIGTLSQPPVYKMGCYNEKNEYLCTTSITTNNEAGACIALQQGGYVSFKDEQGKLWSMQFETEDRAIDFSAHVVVAMYGAAGHPAQSIMACDVASGKQEQSIFANDTIKVRFQSWVIQYDLTRKGLAVLGSRLDGNFHDEKPYTMDVPANHMSVTASMKGFEGMVIGMSEEGSRLVVVPVKAKRGGGPQVHMCFYIYCIKKKGKPSGVIQGESTTLMLKNSSAQGEKTSMQKIAVHSYSGSIPRPSSPPPGFSGEQLLVVDRLRDQVHVLSQQLHEARRELDLFGNDMKLYEEKAKPQSLLSAQVEYSIQKLLADTEEARDLLSQKDITLKQLEEKNRELQSKVEKFSTTANLLSQEKKSTIISSNEEKLDLDRRVAQAESELCRLQSEREDVSRHLSTVKRLLQVADEDMKKEKNNLQIATVAYQTNESKLAATEENHTEEVARRKILESKVSTLGDQLRSVLEEVRVKEGQIEERKRKIESDKLHYTQLIEEERGKAAADLRELRQELVDELALRDRRYQEERQRVAQDSFERGRFQGMEDGQTEALLEADAAIQELTLTAQRRKAEMNAMRIRLKSAQEQGDADERRLNSQMEALNTAVSLLTTDNSQKETELDSLKSSKAVVEENAFQEIKNIVGQLSQSIGRSDLLTLIHFLRVKKSGDYSFETKRLEERTSRLNEEHKEVIEWIQGSLSGAFVPFPPMRTNHAPEPPAAAPPKMISLEDAETSAEIVDSLLENEMRRQEEVVQFNPEEMERRYNEILSELTKSNPDIEIESQKKDSSDGALASTISVLPNLMASNNTEAPSARSEEIQKPQGPVYQQPPHQQQQPQGPLYQQPPQQQQQPQGPVYQQPPQQQQQPQGPVYQQPPQQQRQQLEACDTQGNGESTKLKGECVKDSDTIAKAPHLNNRSEELGSTQSRVDKPHTSLMSSDVPRVQVEHIAPPPNRGVPMRSKKITFSDSDTDDDVLLPPKARTEVPKGKTRPTKKSLFDDSDDSSDRPAAKQTVPAKMINSKIILKKRTLDDSDS